MSDLLLVITADRRPRAFPHAPLLAALLAGMLCSTGCIPGLTRHKQARVFVPPPPRPAPHPPVKPPPIAGDVPVVTPHTEDTLDLASLSIPSIELTPPPAPAPPPKRGPVTGGTKPTPPPQTPEPSAPRLTPLYSKEQVRDFNRSLDETLDRVQRAMETLSRKSLTREQRDTMAQIQDFFTQAKQAREQDLVTAVNLAKHADGLAKDLLDRLP